MKNELEKIRNYSDKVSEIIELGIHGFQHEKKQINENVATYSDNLSKFVNSEIYGFQHDSKSITVWKCPQIENNVILILNIT